MSARNFDYSDEQLHELASQALDLARSNGASACEVDVSEGLGQSVSVRMGEVETIEYNQDKGIDVTVYLGQQKGHASTSDFSSTALADTVAAALNIARYTAADDCAGLADKTALATEFPDLDLYCPWDINVEQSIELARQCEAAGQAVDTRIVNSDGATVNTQTSHFIYANSHGFCAGFPASRHSISAALVAQQGEAMQRDHWFSTARHPEDLLSVEDVGRIAGERSVRRLGAKRIPTGSYPVLFEAPVAGSLIGHLVGALSGGSLYRRSSFLLDSLGKQIFPSWLNMEEDPYLLRGLGSSAFDGEGVTTLSRQIIHNGVVDGYFLGSYSARKLGMTSTGNAGSTHNLIVHSSGESFDELLHQMGRGLVVTELMGQGVNLLTGDYSRGASGFWVENGQIAYPVEEITIAGNLTDMFARVIAVGNDALRQSARRVGSILIESMTVAGGD